MAALDDEDHLLETRKVNTEGLQYWRHFARERVRICPVRSQLRLDSCRDGQTVFEALQKQGVITRLMGGYRLPEWIRFSIGTNGENQRAVEA